MGLIRFSAACPGAGGPGLKMVIMVVVMMAMMVTMMVVVISCLPRGWRPSNGGARLEDGGGDGDGVGGHGGHGGHGGDLF